MMRASNPKSWRISPAPAEARKVKAALLVHLAEHDDRINAAWPPYEAALKAARAKFQAYTYPGTQHGFNNDTTPRYDAAAAKLAWDRTLDHLNRSLRRHSQPSADGETDAVTSRCISPTCRAQQIIVLRQQCPGALGEIGPGLGTYRPTSPHEQAHYATSSSSGSR